MTDIASLGLEFRSDGVVVARDRLRDFNREADKSNKVAGSLKALFGASLAVAAAGLAAFGVGIKGAVTRLNEMDRLSRQLSQTIKNTGNLARTSADEVRAWAEMQEESTGRAAEEIMSVASNLTTFGFSREAFFRALALGDDMAAAWGGDLKQNIEGLARALAEPEKGLAMLTKRGITFSEQQKVMIADFLRTNDLAGAQGVIFEALEAQVKGVAEAGFTGLEKAVHNMQEAWESAFEDLVRGGGKAGDLRDTLVDLAETVSSPEFITAVMGIGSVIVQAVDLAAKAIIALWGKIQEFMNWLNSQQPANMGAPDLAAQLAEQKKLLAASQIPGNGLGGNGIENLFGVFGDDATPRQVLDYKARIRALETEIANRASGIDPIGDGPGAYGDLLANYRTPGSMAGELPFDPYSDWTGGGGTGTKKRDPYKDLILGAKQYIAEQQLEAQALGITEEAASRLRHEQELLNQAANDNIALTPQMRNELADLAQQMAAAEEAARRLNEIYEFGKGVFSSFFGDIKSGIEEGKSLWESLGQAASNALDSIANKALEMAANGIWDMLFGAVMGGLGGNFIGGTVGAPGLQLGFQKGIPGFATGGDFTVGGSGGPDSQLRALRLTPGEKVSIRRPDQIAANGNSPRITVNNYGTPQTYEVQSVSRDEVVLIARDEAASAVSQYNDGMAGRIRDVGGNRWKGFTS